MITALFKNIPITNIKCYFSSFRIWNVLLVVITFEEKNELCILEFDFHWMFGRVESFQFIAYYPHNLLQRISLEGIEF